MVPSSSLTPYLNRFSNFMTVGLWNSAIREAVTQGHSHKALILFRQMKRNGFEPDNFTFPFVAKACSKLSHIRFSQMIHTHVVKSPFQPHVFVQTAVVDMYVKCNQLGDAYNMFEKMPVRDVAAWNSMIVGFSQSGFDERVLFLFHQMRFAGIWPDSVTVMGLTQVSSYSKNVELLKAIHSIGIRIGLEADISVTNTWICAYAKCGDLDLAKFVFDRIDSGLKTAVSWNSMIAAYSNFEKFIDALHCYKKMLRDGYRPDLSTIVSLLSSCAQPEALLRGASIHCHGIQLGCNSDISVVNTLISMYSKCGDIVSAKLLFDSMSDRTCVSWTVMISGYAEKGDLDEALRLFHAMEAAGKKPDLVTVLSLISGFSQTGALELGKWINSYAFSNGFGHNTVVFNALIDMYAKCGSMNDARELFCLMPEKTLVSWTTMISGCALNGEVKEALDLFNRLLASGLKPNHITFLAVLQACTHSGLLEKGMEFFDMMTNVYFITPGLDHYSCMVDLLGRKGKIKEALDLVQNMSVKPDVGIWSALLSACKNHQSIEIAEYASARLFELDPLVAVPYVEMANIYASDQKWDGVAAIRKMMKSNKVKKFPGQSIIQVNGKPHVFAVEDRGHPEGLLIYEMLDSLILQLKEE
ncbi:Tetratricopeptide-like helical domain containing protein [Trema orientale]|uniref:Tetratricopeptide-like helical domain containing protein n=1 Tax=Trema orientale TaxID=63057 RepID=A0A2P5EM39_TREOI|nr:Tetratricopeptide-like helical domain containing protein [Trema orientale]